MTEFYQGERNCWNKYSGQEITIKSTIPQIRMLIAWSGEFITGRGGNEMASCLMSYINSVSKTITSIAIWTDYCPSKNRNVQMIMCYFHILAMNPTIKQISHKFLLRGHTHMEMDSIHSVIERESKKYPNYKIMTPWDWMQLARLSGKTRTTLYLKWQLLIVKTLTSSATDLTRPFKIARKQRGAKKLCLRVFCILKSDFDQEFDSR